MVGVGTVVVGMAIGMSIGMAAAMVPVPSGR
jgi:hypothetical protein